MICSQIRHFKNSYKTMSRILVSDRQQLKCNFCTKWFSVSGAFASIQRYSVNSCPNCLKNFHYKIIDSETYDIYEILLIKSGIKLLSDQICIKNSSIITNLTNREGSVILGSEAQQKIKQSQEMFTIEINKIKKKLQDYYKSKFDKWIEQWKEANAQMDKYRQKNFIKVAEQTTTMDYQSLLEQINKTIELDLKNINKRFIQITAIQSKQALINSKFVQHQRQPHQKYPRNSCVNDLKRLRKKVLENQFFDNQNKTLHTCSSIGNMNNTLKNNFPQQQKKVLKSNKKLEIAHNLPSYKKDSGNWGKRSSYSKDSEIETPTTKLSKVPSKSNMFLKKSSSAQRLDINNTLTTTTHQSQRSVSGMDELKDIILRTLKQGIKFQSFLPFRTAAECISQYEKQNGSKSLVSKIIQLNNQTIIMQNQCQLISRDISRIDFWCYLKTLDWNSSIKALKLVKIKLEDANFDILLYFLSGQNCKNIQTLVLTNNLLTDACLQGLLTYFNRNPCSCLNSIYMGNNFIKPSYGSKYAKILKDMGINVYI